MELLNDDAEKDFAAAVRIDFPVFEGGGSHMNISGIALTKAAPNKAAAVKLMEWLSSDEAQKIYAETNHEFPVKPGVARSALVLSWGPFTPDTLGLADIAKARQAYAEGNSVVGKQVTQALQMTILGSGVASQLLNVRPRVQLSQGPGAPLLGFGMARSSRCHALRR